jgi:hypothetical protein
MKQPCWSRRKLCCALPAAATVLSLDRALAQPIDQPDDGTWSKDPTWDILRRTRLTTDARGMVNAQIAPEVKALVGRQLVISGFILPIETTMSFRHFILSRYSPECPFCPAGAPNEVIEVFSTVDTGPTNYMAFYQGRFSVQNKVEEGLFYRLENARVA